MSRRHVRATPPTKLRGPQGFEEYYRGIFGERWAGLRHLLLHPEQLVGEGRVVRLNGFADPASQAWATACLEPGPVESTLWFRRHEHFDGRDTRGIRTCYVMDPASIIAARALPLAGCSQIADLCAAPGGKSLVLAERMDATARLVVNDRSEARRRRLRQVLDDYLPPTQRVRVTVSGSDARRVGRAFAEQFDAVLLDVPCSSEAHVLTDPSALAAWSQGRSERLAKDQYALVTSALAVLRPGGFLLYSTCALSPLENDGVVGRLLEKGRHPVRVSVLSLPQGLECERTRYGLTALPDRSGAGPLYWALLQKPPASEHENAFHSLGVLGPSSTTSE